MKIKFDGILMLKDRSFGEIHKRFSFPERAVVLDPSVTHITLIHYDILSPYKDILNSKEFVFPTIPKIQFENKIWYRIDEKQGRETWALKVTPTTQKALEKFVDSIRRDLGINIRENRTFHISLANLTGNPRHSVR
jgi:hypothetical protein